MGVNVGHILRRELTGRKLAFNLFFYGTHIGLFAYGWWKQDSDERLALLNTLKFSVWISRGAGLVLGYDGCLIVLPVLRNLIMFLRPKLSWLMPLDENIFFHRQVAYSILFFTIVHTTAHYVNFIVVEQVQARPGDTAAGIHYTMPGGFTGHVMLAIMMAMYTTAHKKIRQQCFEAFWYTHHLFIFFLLGLYTHATGCFVRGALPGQPVQCLGYFTWRFTLPCGLLYFCERMWREIRARRKTNLVGVLMHPSGAMELRFRKPSFKYVSGQWLFLNVPDVSTFQWHPFTISSSPLCDDYVSVHIRQAGDWTHALGDRLGCSTALAAQLTKDAKAGSDFDTVSQYGQATFTDISKINPNASLPAIRVDGPYGAPAEDVCSFECAVLVATGIGVTPWASVLKTIIAKYRSNTLKPLRRVYFIWLNRDASGFEWFASMLRELEAQIDDPDLISIQTYLTSNLTEDQINNVVMNSQEETDAVTSLRSRTQFGRPNWPQFFGGIRNGIETGTLMPGRESALKTNVGVFYCGPPVLAKTLKEECTKAKSNNVNFRLYKEHF